MRECNRDIDYSNPRQRMDHYGVQNKVKIEDNIEISIVDVMDNDCANKFKIDIKDVPNLPKNNIQGNFDDLDTTFTMNIQLAGNGELIVESGKSL